jgi:hypothetical protein
MARGIVLLIALITSSAAFKFDKSAIRSAQLSARSLSRGEITRRSTTQLSAASLSLDNIEDLGKPVAYGPHLKIKGKVLTGWGVMYALITFAIATLVFPFMLVLSFICDLFGNKKVRLMLYYLSCKYLSLQRYPLSSNCTMYHKLQPVPTTSVMHVLSCISNARYSTG